MNKKVISIFLAAILFVFCLSGCGTNIGHEEETVKLSVVTTIFPQYDWVRQILGDRSEHVELTLLMDSGVDLHNYQPTVDDIVKISNCDLFIYVGGASDGWVDAVLKAANNKDMQVINLLDVLGDRAKEEEIVEGMEHNHDHEHDHDHDHDHNHDHDHDHDHNHDHDHDHEYDEHVWLSLRNAKLLCAEISNALCVLDEAGAETYKSNLATYTDKLDALDAAYKTAVDAATFDTVLFADRFPFRYLVDDYELSYYAAFSGCSAETEASFETIAFLAGKVDELALTSVFVIESADQSIAKTVIRNTQTKDQNILVLDSLQSITQKDITDSKTYLSIMTENLASLKAGIY